MVSIGILNSSLSGITSNASLAPSSACFSAKNLAITDNGLIVAGGHQLFSGKICRPMAKDKSRPGALLLNPRPWGVFALFHHTHLLCSDFVPPSSPLFRPGGCHQQRRLGTKNSYLQYFLSAQIGAREKPQFGVLPRVHGFQHAAVVVLPCVNGFQHADGPPLRQWFQSAFSGMLFVQSLLGLLKQSVEGLFVQSLSVSGKRGTWREERGHGEERGGSVGVEERGHGEDGVVMGRREWGGGLVMGRREEGVVMGGERRFQSAFSGMLFVQSLLGPQVYKKNGMLFIQSQSAFSVSGGRGTWRECIDVF